MSSSKVFLPRFVRLSITVLVYAVSTGCVTTAPDASLDEIQAVSEPEKPVPSFRYVPAREEILPEDTILPHAELPPIQVPATPAPLHPDVPTFPETVEAEPPAGLAEAGLPTAEPSVTVPESERIPDGEPETETGPAEADPPGGDHGERVEEPAPTQVEDTVPSETTLETAGESKGPDAPDAPDDPITADTGPPVREPAPRRVDRETVAAAENVPRASPEPLLEISAAPGQDISFPIEGIGWIYLGEETGSGGITYKSRSFRGNSTFFDFKALSEGTYDLRFQRQDSRTGGAQYASVLISVGTGAEPVTADGISETGDPVRADSLFAAGDSAGALREYYMADDDDDPVINDRIALLAFENRDFRTAAKYWTRNIGASDYTVASRAARSVLGLGVVLGDPGILSGLDDQAMRWFSKEDAGDLMSAALVTDAAGDIGTTRLLLEGTAEFMGPASRMDWVFYRLGQIYESDGEFRNERKAVRYYQVVLDEYPASLYWEDARERIAYLTRHFLEIR